MKIARKSLAVLLMVGLLLGSCAGQAPEGSETPDIGASLTAGVGTIVAYFFQTQTAMAPAATETPSITPIPAVSSSPIVFPTLGSLASPTSNFIFPSATPTGTYYTPTPNAGSLAYGCNNLGFIRDVSTPNGTVLRPNESFTRTWKVVNNGTCDWLHGFRLVPVSGFEFASDAIGVHNAPVKPGEWREFSVGAQAPDDAGTFTQNWQLSDGAGHTFGSTLSISIIVRAPTRTPQPTATSTSTSTSTIVPPPAGPTIASISPNSATVDSTVNLTITGSGFVSGTSVSLEGGTGASVTVNSISDTAISATVTVDATATPGTWNVKVTNANGSTSIAFTIQ